MRRRKGAEGRHKAGQGGVVNTKDVIGFEQLHHIDVDPVSHGVIDLVQDFPDALGTVVQHESREGLGVPAIAV